MVRVYRSAELPPEDVYVLEKRGYDIRGYSYVAIGTHEYGHSELKDLFGSAHIVSPTDDYNEPAVFHYALIGLK